MAIAIVTSSLSDWPHLRMRPFFFMKQGIVTQG